MHSQRISGVLHCPLVSSHGAEETRRCDQASHRTLLLAKIGRPLVVALPRNT